MLNNWPKSTQRDSGDLGLNLNRQTNEYSLYSHTLPPLWPPYFLLLERKDHSSTKKIFLLRNCITMGPQLSIATWTLTLGAIAAFGVWFANQLCRVFSARLRQFKITHVLPGAPFPSPQKISQALLRQKPLCIHLHCGQQAERRKEREQWSPERKACSHLQPGQPRLHGNLARVLNEWKQISQLFPQRMKPLDPSQENESVPPPDQKWEPQSPRNRNMSKGGVWKDWSGWCHLSSRESPQESGDWEWGKVVC